MSNRKIIDLSQFPIAIIGFFCVCLNLITISLVSQVHPRDFNTSPNNFNIAIIQSVNPCILMISLAFAFIAKSKPLQKFILTALGRRDNFQLPSRVSDN